MLRLLETQKEIAQAQGLLEASLRAELPTTIRRDIGYPGGTEYDLIVHTDGHYWFRTGRHDGTGQRPRPRYLNWFGLLGGRSLEITVECNPPVSGINAALSGFFAQDLATGNIYLMHSGGVGGGARGVGQKAFLTWSHAHLLEVADSRGAVRLGIAVVPLGAKAASRPLKKYIDQIAAFKAAVRNGEVFSPEFRARENQLGAFYSEPRGRRSGSRNDFDYESRHGDVVDALNDWRLARGLKRGLRIVKNVWLDMGVARDEDLHEAYEVKTSAGRSAIYGALGQLFVHAPSDSCRRTLVLPEGEAIPADVAEAIQRLGIQLLRFRLSSAGARIL